MRLSLAGPLGVFGYGIGSLQPEAILSKKGLIRPSSQKLVSGALVALVQEDDDKY